jgi:hypothetical protein
MSKVPMARLVPVQVDWLDSSSHDGWQTMAEAKAHHRNKMHCRSVGLLVADNEHGITITHSIHQQNVAGTMHIPRGAVTKVRRLR